MIFFTHLRQFTFFFVALFFFQNSFAQSFQPKMKSIYHKGWIDLNKNGKKDIYEDPEQPVDKRIYDLLSQMTLDEKTCQTATLYGYHRVLKDSLPTPEWKDEIWKDGIANIDEHLNGFPVHNLDIITDIKKHVWAMNTTQAFFIEDTRLEFRLILLMKEFVVWKLTELPVFLLNWLWEIHGIKIW